MDINRINLDNGYKLIEASAGTGKTFTLAHLFLRTYFENQLKIENILLLSFTNKTCNELKERIIDRVLKLELLINNKISKKDLDQTIVLWYEKQISNNNKRKILVKIKEFFNNINSLKIFTFHGFCNNILENHSFEIKSPQGFTVNNELEYLYNDIINELWISEYTNLNKNIIKAIHEKKIKSKWAKVSNINKRFFLNLLKDIDNENIFKYKLNNNYKDDLSALLKDYIHNNWLQFCSNWEKNGHDLFLKLIELGTEIKEKGFNSNIYKSKPRKKFDQINKWIENVNNNIFNNVDEYQYIYEITKSDLLTKYFYRKSIYKEVDKFDISIDLSEFDDLQESIYKIKDGFFNQFIRIFLNKLFFKLIQRKNDSGIINYSDIIKIIEEKFLLDSKAIILFKDVLNNYKSVFIDEFQDTDKVQWSIISKFFKNPEHLLICVGDPKQAIYKFRGGDIKAYLKAKNEAVEIYKLDINYRSSKSLIKTINEIYKNGLKSSNIDYAPLLSKSISSSEESNKTFNIIEFKNEKYVAELTLDLLFRLLASEEKENLENIAILTSNNYQCLFYKNLLSKNNIPCNIVNKKNIFDTEASYLLDFFLQCIYNPNSSRNINLLATSKLIQTDIKYLLEDENSNEIDFLFRKFKKWNLEIKDRGFISILKEFIIIFKSPKLINDLGLYSDLFKLSEFIEEKLITENFNISKVITWYKYEINSFSRTCKGDEYIVNKDQSSAINISTVHSSKGLEYEIVICPYLWDQKKVSSKTNGPIWKNSNNNEIYINIENTCKKVSNIRGTEFIEELNELERLIYVALTRAKQRLFVFNNIENTDNILNNYLLMNLDNYEDYKYQIDSVLEDKDIKKIKDKFQVNINNEFEKIYYSKKQKKEVLINEKIIIRSSYSSWIRGIKNFNLFNLDKDYDENIIYPKKITNIVDNIDNPKFKEPNPLSEFPRGTNSGSCLHNILEKLNFQEINNIYNFNNIIEEELFAYGIDKSFTKNIKDGLKRVMYSSLGEKFKNQRLIDLNPSDILKEIKFHLPLSIDGESISSSQLSKCFLLNKDFEFGEDYANEVRNLNINSKGFHSGSIDCLLKIKGNDDLSKWWIIDWKSNFISNQDNNKSLPINYKYENMRLEMIKHHYPLQSHLYLLAVHRLLNWRLENYSPKKDLGGYIYIFLRGLPCEKIENKSEYSKYPLGIFYSSTPLDRILYLDKLFKNEIK